MRDSKSSLKLAQRVIYFIVSACLLIIAFIPEQEALVGGFVVGLFASLINSWHLQWKTMKFVEIVAKTAKKPRFSLGFLTRASVGVLAYVVSKEVLDYNYYMTIVGLFVVQLVTMAILGKSKSSVERGEKETWNI